MDKHAKKLSARSGNAEEGAAASDGGSEVGSITDSDSEDKVSTFLILITLKLIIHCSCPHHRSELENSVSLCSHYLPRFSVTWNEDNYG